MNNICADKTYYLIYEKYLLEILEAEAKMSKCLQILFCECFMEELKCVKPIEKRVALTSNLLCAYAHKEKEMAKLITSLKIPPARYFPIRCNNRQPCGYNFRYR
ncbi:hypothetical protein [Clostridium sp. BJN0001]|uniref:hypothetical protein n=1 Tax=Clostridium sp. BJN0001 TaxID=2930219 RepID=UPI001FCFB9DE|nr:hypothetical protein [Clostridium sp. BJN0001]